METKKPLLKRWYIKATFIIIGALVAYLIVDSFIAGFKEGRQMRQKELQLR
jgi:hypothetical protein